MATETSGRREAIAIPPDTFDDVDRLLSMHKRYGNQPLSAWYTRLQSNEYSSLMAARLRRTSQNLMRPAQMRTIDALAMQSVRLGQILFLCTISPSISVAGVYSHAIAGALKDALEVFYLQRDGLCMWPYELLLWLLFNGLITEKAGAAKIWFRSRVVEIIWTRGIRDFGQVKSLLTETCWSEDIFEALCRDAFERLSIMPYANDGRGAHCE
jgi:hypothetical protein